jgi:hypothetical protein
MVSRRFKVTKSHLIDRWKVNGGKISGERYLGVVHLMSKEEAQRIADARNRLVMKHPEATRRARVMRRKP